jgi:hypothetical protein
MAKKTIDIGALSKAQQEAIKKQIEDAKTAGQGAEAARAKEAVDFYYDVQEELEAVLIEKLTAKPKKGGGTEPSKLAMRAAGPNGWSTTKLLKIIANLPNKMPEKDAGYITAARNIEVGKKKPLTAEQKEKKKQAAVAKKQQKGRDNLFEGKVSARKTKALAKKKATAKKKAPAKK